MPTQVQVAPAPTSRTGQNSANAPRTEYVYNSGGGSGIRRQYQRGSNVITHEAMTAPVRNGLPPFLGNRMLLGGAWLASMVMVGWDDWHNNGILPRPSRLWYTSLFFGLLAFASMVDAIVPIVNALAIGYTIMLLWQLFNGQGTFAKGT